MMLTLVCNGIGWRIVYSKRSSNSSRQAGRRRRRKRRSKRSSKGSSLKGKKKKKEKVLILYKRWQYFLVLTKNEKLRRNLIRHCHDKPHNCCCSSRCYLLLSQNAHNEFAHTHTQPRRIRYVSFLVLIFEQKIFFPISLYFTENHWRPIFRVFISHLELK